MAAEPVTEQVAEHIEEVAQVTREINPQALRYFFGGVGVGLAVGFFFGYRFNREKIRAEAFAQSAEEIQQMREMYQKRDEKIKGEAARAVAARQKPSMDELIEEKGYRVAAEEDESHRPLKAPVPVSPARIQTTKKTYRTELAEKDKMDGWSFPKELAQRTPHNPYIIHQDEFTLNESEFEQVSYVYYVEDDVLAAEDDSILTNRDELIGGSNVLARFGHGTDDYNILYIRNPVLELEMEICRSPKSYEEEVLGLDRNESHDAQEE